MCFICLPGGPDGYFHKGRSMSSPPLIRLTVAGRAVSYTHLDVYKRQTVAYALFSAIFAFSAICPIKFLQSAFVGAMEKNNIAQEYIDGMLNITSVPMLVVIVAAGLVGGLIGAVIGQKALKKHFIKAGLVSVK